MIKIPKINFRNNECFACLGRTRYKDYATDTDNVIYKVKNDNFSVTINDIDCEVRECRVSAVPYNRPWPGKQRQYSQTESAGFISFSADESVTLRVKSKKAFKTASVKPSSKNIKVDIQEDEAVFTLSNQGNYVLELDDTHNVLHIFFNHIKDYPDKDKATYYYGPGMHFPGIINLRDNDMVYIDEEAIVFGSINSVGAKNVKIFGGGILDNSCEERVTENCYENFTKGTFRIYNSENIDVSDIIFTNSSTWVMSMFYCKNINIDNVKIVGHWRYNTDGIDIVNSDNVTVRNSFIRSFDDTISIKGIYEYDKPIENILIDNCVMWCGWGKNCEIGVETACPEYKNIVFKNCDLIHNSVAALTVSNGCNADIHDVLFENINVELQSCTPCEVVQTEDGKPYDQNAGTHTPFLALAYNFPYTIRKRNPDAIEMFEREDRGNIHDVVYRNINVICDDKDVKPVVKIRSCDDSVIFKNFVFENIFVNGKKASSFDEFETVFENSENITIK